MAGELIMPSTESDAVAGFASTVPVIHHDQLVCMSAASESQARSHRRKATPLMPVFAFGALMTLRSPGELL